MIAEPKANVSDRLMSPKESEILISELRTWCDEKYGRRAEVAGAIGVSRQIVTDWLKGRAVPNLDNGLQLMRFLKAQKEKQN